MITQERSIESTSRRTSFHEVLVVGGGAAGITAAARLRNAGVRDVAIVEPSATHAYQPLWTLVGGGVVDKRKSVRPQIDVIPRGVQWIRDRVVAFRPDENAVDLASGAEARYRFLVVAVGIQLDWDRVEGLRDALETPFVSSNYRYDLCDKTWTMLRDFRGGTALFTFPAGPIKCAGAPQKIAYLAADHFRRRGIDAHVVYAAASPAIFGVKAFQEPLNAVVRRYGIDARYAHDLVAVDGARREATFVRLDDPDRARVAVPYDVLHVTPPQSAPDVVKASVLAETEGPQKGYVAVDRTTLRHVRYPNVFALGDAGSTPNSKTAAAVRKQAPVMVGNLLDVRAGRAPSHRYDGYASCPLVTGYGKLILAEFDYDGNPKPTFPFDETKERRSMYALKRWGLPFLYWNLMLKGRA